MSLTSALAIYFVIWWIVLFAVLPWGVSTEPDEAAPVPGAADSAPRQPYLLRKALATTVLAGIIFAGFYVVYTRHLLTLDDIPFLPRYDGK